MDRQAGLFRHQSPCCGRSDGQQRATRRIAQLPVAEVFGQYGHALVTAAPLQQTDIISLYNRIAALFKRTGNPFGKTLAGRFTARSGYISRPARKGITDRNIIRILEHRSHQVDPFGTRRNEIVHQAAELGLVACGHQSQRIRHLRAGRAPCSGLRLDAHRHHQQDKEKQYFFHR